MPVDPPPMAPGCPVSSIVNESSRNQFARSDGTTETSLPGRSLVESKCKDLGICSRKRRRSSWLPRVRCKGMPDRRRSPVAAMKVW